MFKINKLNLETSKTEIFVIKNVQKFETISAKQKNFDLKVESHKLKIGRPLEE